MKKQPIRNAVDRLAGLLVLPLFNVIAFQYTLSCIPYGVLARMACMILAVAFNAIYVALAIDANWKITRVCAIVFRGCRSVVEWLTQD